MSSEESSEREVEAEDPEFFDPTRHRFKKLTKEQAWMGVFHDGSEDEKEAAGTNKRYSTGISFVQSHSGMPSKLSESEDSEGLAQPRDMAEDYEDLHAFQGFQQSQPKAGEGQTKPHAKTSTRGVTFTPIMRKVPSNPIKPLPKDYASFLNNPQGNVIRKMMEKMGFQEGQGLGPEGKGRVAPIEVKLRGKQSGIGFGSKEQPEVISEPESESEEEPKAGQLLPKPKKSKIQYQTLDEAMARVELALGNMGGSLAPNLNDDVRLVVDLSKDNLVHLELSMKNMNLQRRQALQEQEALQPLLDRATQEQAALEALAALCTRLEQVCLEVTDFVALRPHLATLEEQRRLAQDASLSKFISARLQEMAVSLVAPQFTRLMEVWDVEAEPLLMVDFFQEWANLFVPTLRAEDDFEETRNVWDPQTSDAALALLQAWSPVLPTFIVRFLIEQGVVPKLLASLEAWSPHTTPASFHFCFHPWLPLLADGLDALRPTIRAKLATIIRDLDSFPPELDLFSAYIQPWLPILSAKDRVKLIDRTAYAKLQYVLSSRLIIDPSDQTLDHFVRALHWHGSMAPAQFGELLANSFFPNFAKVLSQWLALDPPITDIMQWYTFWKSLLPQDIITTPPVEGCLRSFLAQVNAYMDLGGAHA
ncbi:hypothetical protein L0F63_002435 [Massospora cicadina]|nr:hypothetical protein L0F63_002435 [Massospora cicadina]